MCPHCYPLSFDNAWKIAEELNVLLHVLDIDFEDQEKASDDLVCEYGDFNEDYLIPQVFIEYESASYIAEIQGNFSKCAPPSSWPIF